jgi:hypothetical protein
MDESELGILFLLFSLVVGYLVWYFAFSGNIQQGGSTPARTTASNRKFEAICTCESETLPVRFADVLSLSLSFCFFVPNVSQWTNTTLWSKFSKLSPTRAWRPAI